MTILFLYTELATYFIKCCEHLSQHGTVHIVRWPVNNEAPFEFNFGDRIRVYDRKAYTRHKLKALVETIDPDIIICSGWIDKDYVKVTRRYFGKVPTVLAFDTSWRGGLKQHLAGFLSSFYLLNTFSHCWVPGQPQTDYAKRLGFRTSRIKRGFYCCDLGQFNSLYDQLSQEKKGDFPKRFIYVGRYHDFKGITDLWQAFVAMKEEEPNDWELWCVGTGSIPPIEHPAIKHFGFVQPAELGPIMAQTGVFVLPSRFEPWGVVVQEFSAAGYPLILSHMVGARDIFLREDTNGITFRAENINSLKNALKKISKLDGKALTLMSEQSHRVAQMISHSTWVDTVLEMYDEFRKK